MSYKKALERLILEPLRLRNTYYFNGRTPDYVLDRMPAGFYNDPTCLQYQPTPCNISTLAPLLGMDVRGENLSWAGPAGGIIAILGDLSKWYRALFGLHVVPQAQLPEMESLVSMRSGLPIPATTPANSGGYGLALVQEYSAALFGGPIWYYEGETLAYRVVFAYWPQYDLVITMAANSNVADAVSIAFPETVLSSALKVLVDTDTVQNLGASITN